jgi:hypothetical protein
MGSRSYTQPSRSQLRVRIGNTHFRGAAREPKHAFWVPGAHRNDFTERLVAVDVEARERLVGVVLLRDEFSARCELFHVLVGPPRLEVAVPVVLTPLIVEAVGEFVADGRGQGTVVRGVVGLGFEEWRLEDARVLLQGPAHRKDLDGVDG